VRHFVVHAVVDGRAEKTLPSAEDIAEPHDVDVCRLDHEAVGLLGVLVEVLSDEVLGALLRVVGHVVYPFCVLGFELLRFSLA
jgi:hypothetical protein